MDITTRDVPFESFGRCMGLLSYRLYYPRRVSMRSVDNLLKRSIIFPDLCQRGYVPERASHTKNSSQALELNCVGQKIWALDVHSHTYFVLFSKILIHTNLICVIPLTNLPSNSFHTRYLKG